MFEKRGMKLGDYNTAVHDWTLATWKLSDAPQKTNFVEKPSGDGSWDLSTALTDGILKYGDRTFSATFECSTGDRLARETKIRDMINQLDGMVANIELPDDHEHYVVGRLKVVRNYNDLAHCSVSVSATCEPWKYNYNDTEIRLTASPETKIAQLVNNGRRAVVPVITLTGDNASVLLSYDSKSLSMAAGTRQWPDLILTPGVHPLTYSGSGSLLLSYKEAVLE